MEFLTKLSAAITGELLFRLVYVVEHFTLIPVRLYQLFKLIFQTIEQRGLVANLLAGILSTTISLFLVTLIVLNPLILLGAVLGDVIINHTMYVGFKGALTGWKDGFAGVFQHCADRFEYIRWQLTGNYRPTLNVAPINIPSPISLNLEYLNSILRQPLERIAPVRPSAPVTDNLILSDAEFTLLINNQHPLLTNTEMARLESVSNANVLHQVTSYKTLLDRLETTGVCSILYDKPEKQEAVLLVKMYTSRDGRTLPVPLSSTIFSRVELMNWLREYHNTHPLTRDSIAHPTLYEGFATHYVIHPYYATLESTSGISQELSDLAGVLRLHLSQQPQPQSERERMIAARLRTFASGSDDRGHDARCPDTAQNTMRLSAD